MWWLTLALACTPADSLDSGTQPDSSTPSSDCSQEHSKVGLSVELTALTEGTTGTLHVDDDCSVRVSNFTFTYTDELDTRFELWLDEEPAGVPADANVQPPVTNETRVLPLPDGFTHDDWDQLSLFDPALNVLHALARP